MKTLGKIVAVAMLARGAVLLASPHGYLRYFGQECMPGWMRAMVKPWLQIPRSHLRGMGLYLVLIAALIFGLADEAGGQEPAGE